MLCWRDNRRDEQGHLRGRAFREHGDDGHAEAFAADHVELVDVLAFVVELHDDATIAVRSHVSELKA